MPLKPGAYAYMDVSSEGMGDSQADRNPYAGVMQAIGRYLDAPDASILGPALGMGLAAGGVRPVSTAPAPRVGDLTRPMPGIYKGHPSQGRTPYPPWKPVEVEPISDAERIALLRSLGMLK